MPMYRERTLCYTIDMSPKITNEMRDALNEHAGQPVRVEDDQTHKTYYLVAESDAPELIDNWLARELQKGFDAADRGEVSDWDPQRIKAEGRRLLAEGTDTP